MCSCLELALQNLTDSCPPACPVQSGLNYMDVYIERSRLRIILPACCPVLASLINAQNVVNRKNPCQSHRFIGKDVWYLSPWKVTRHVSNLAGK